METAHLCLSRQSNNSYFSQNSVISSPRFTHKMLIPIAIGTILAIAGIFIVMAAFQVLPHGMNAISSWGTWGYLAGAVPIAGGVITLLVGLILYFRSTPEKQKFSQDTTLIPQKEKTPSETWLSNTSQTLASPPIHDAIDDTAFKHFCAYRKGSNKDKAYTHAIGASFFSCDKDRDSGWGCAWRCIQICASTLNLMPSFDALFEKYRLTKAPNEWAEPGYGKRYLDDQEIPSQLILYDKEQGTDKTPTESCTKICGFLDLRNKLIEHFNKYATPVMADDVTYALTIVGIRVTSEEETILFIADPHKISPKDGLYYVVLDNEGKQIATTGIDDGKNGLSTVKCVYFFNKGWMLLFPQPENILKCPDKFQLFYDLAPKEISNLVLHSPLYTLEEKQVVFSAAQWIYGENTHSIEEWSPITAKGWIDQRVTMNYLNGLSLLYPYFTTFSTTPCSPGFQASIEFEDIRKDLILESLPHELKANAPHLYGHALRINRNHRTAFVIDLEMATVEYWNSLPGNEHAVFDFFIDLGKELTKKYHKPFTYISPTRKTHFQNNTYDCGVWACKFLEERILQAEAIKNGESFSFKNCQKPKFDMVTYRKKVFADAYCFQIYFDIGQIKLASTLNDLGPSGNEICVSSTDVYRCGKTGTVPECLRI